MLNKQAEIKQKTPVRCIKIKNYIYFLRTHGGLKTGHPILFDLGNSAIY